MRVAKLIGNTALLQQHVNQFTGSGIVYAPRYMDDRKQWIVIATGPGKRLPSGTIVPPELQRGQKCLYDVGKHGNLHDLGHGLILVDAAKVEMVWT